MAHLLNSNTNQCSQICKDIGALVKVNATANSPKSLESAEYSIADKKNYQYETPTTKHDSRITSSLPEFQPGLDGKIDWTHLAELTGTRPNVSKYALERYTSNEWKKRNENILDQSILHEANLVLFNGKSTISQAIGETDLKRNYNTDKLKERARDVFRWKVAFEHACKAMAQEILLLENDRQRIKQIFKALLLSESIAKECIELRNNKSIPELLADVTDQELNKEKALLEQTKKDFIDALNKTEEQLEANKAAKQTIEYGRTNKELCYDLSETASLRLTPKSNTIMFRPGAVRYAEKNSSTPEMYDYYSNDTLLSVEATRQRSIDLRGMLKFVIQNGAQKLKLQADATDMALVNTVRMNQEVCKKMETTLKDTLQRIAELDILIESLHGAIRKMDSAMKLAQTRLDIRNSLRLHVEGVIDKPQIGLVQEVKQIHDSVSSLRAQLTNTLSVRQRLMEKRLQLEKEIANKMQSIIIDKQRCQIVRSYYPEVSELRG